MTRYHLLSEIEGLQVRTEALPIVVLRVGPAVHLVKYLPCEREEFH